MTKQEAAAAALIALIDELGDLDAELAPLKAKFNRLETLRAAVRGAVSGEGHISGDRWTAIVGAPGGVSVIDRAALMKLIGPTKFAALASVSLKALTQACGADVVGSVVSTEATGPRSLAIVPRAANGANGG